MGHHRVKLVKFPMEKRSNHHTIVLPVTPWGYCVMVFWFDGRAQHGDVG